MVPLKLKQGEGGVRIFPLSNALRGNHLFGLVWPEIHLKEYDCWIEPSQIS